MAYNGKDNIVRDGIRNNRGDYRESRKSKKRMGIKLIPVYLIAVVCVALFSWVVSGKEGSKSADLGYEENAVVVTDEDELQKLVDEMIQNKDGEISLEYKNIASSIDGSNFTCYIANSAKNQYDMYVGIYTDASYEEELYLSQLMKPGSGIKEFECNKELVPGSYDTVLVFTLVDDDHETIRSQTPVEYTMVVTE